MPLSPPPFNAEPTAYEHDANQPVRIIRKIGYLSLLAASTSASLVTSAGMNSFYGIKQGAGKVADAIVGLVEYDLEDSAMPIKFRRRKNEDD